MTLPECTISPTCTNCTTGLTTDPIANRHRGPGGSTAAERTPATSHMGRHWEVKQQRGAAQGQRSRSATSRSGTPVGLKRREHDGRTRPGDVKFGLRQSAVAEPLRPGTTPRSSRIQAGRLLGQSAIEQGSPSWRRTTWTTNPARRYHLHHLLQGRVPWCGSAPVRPANQRSGETPNPPDQDLTASDGPGPRAG